MAATDTLAALSAPNRINYYLGAGFGESFIDGNLAK
jgi:hypothetical protein